VDDTVAVQIIQRMH
jgi:hypothetical protein